MTTDLREVLANTTASEHDLYAVAFRTPFGEVRLVTWLTEAEAKARRDVLRKRGYIAVAGPMDIGT